MNEVGSVFHSIGLLLGIGGFFASNYVGYYDSLLFNTTCCVLWLIIILLLAVWVYKDAESRGMSGALWVIVFLLLGFIGLIIYLIVRKPVQQPRVQYGYQNIQGYGYPPPQTAQTSSPQIIKEKEIIKEVVKIKCPYCGALVDQGIDRCPNCGAPLR